MESRETAWLRFVFSPQQPVPEVSDWRTLYDFSDKQNIIGICDSTKQEVKIDIETITLWLGTSTQIASRNILLNKRV